MRHPLLALALASLGATALPAQAAEIDVMTQNQYLGFDILAVVTAPDFDVAVAEGLETRAAGTPTDRMRALAKLIGGRNPALVALEETYRFTCEDFDATPSVGCEDPAIAGAFTDQLNDTVKSLGGRYRVAGVVNNLDIVVPVEYKGRTLYVGVLDRDAILARKDVQTAVIPFGAHCKYASADGCNYEFVASQDIEIGGNPVNVKFQRGYVGVFATVQGQQYSFVATHLETRLDGYVLRVFQSGQTLELLQAVTPLAGPGSKLIVAGDFNSDPSDEILDVSKFPQDFLNYLLYVAKVPADVLPWLGVPPYQLMVGAGLTDVWNIRPGKSKNPKPAPAGYSCCQDEDLANKDSALYERIDLIFSSVVPANVPDVRLLGDRMADKTLPRPFGVWPSDHASVAAKMIFGR